MIIQGRYIDSAKGDEQTINAAKFISESEGKKSARLLQRFLHVSMQIFNTY